MVLEKAYAKKFGSFSIIEGGLIDYAFGDLTNGVTQRYEKHDISNVAKLWSLIMDAKNDKAYLGASSPKHPDGDQTTSASGIV